MHLLRHHDQYCLNSLQHCGDEHHLSRPPCQQESAVLSKAGLAFVLIAFFVATIIIAATTAADAVAIAIAITVAIAITIAIAVAVATAPPPPPLLRLPSPSPSPSPPEWDVRRFCCHHHRPSSMVSPPLHSIAACSIC